MCVPMCAGRFLDMPEVRPQRGAASGGKRRSIGAAKSMVNFMGGLEPRSGTTIRPLARAFYWPRGLAAC